MDVAVLDTPYPALRKHLSARSIAAAAALDVHVVMLKRATHLGQLTGAPGQWRPDDDHQATSELADGWIADWQLPAAAGGDWTAVTSVTLASVRPRVNHPPDRSERP